MKKFVLYLISVIFLLSCAGTVKYIRAKNPGEIGYYDTKIQGNMYRVSYRGAKNTHPSIIKNYLLFRCAELTIDNNYQYFIILEHDIFSEEFMETATSIKKSYDNADPQTVSPPSIETFSSITKTNVIEGMYLIQMLTNTEGLSGDTVVFNALEITSLMGPDILNY